MATLTLFRRGGEWWCRSDTSSLVRLGIHEAPVGSWLTATWAEARNAVARVNPGHRVIVEGRR